MRVFWGVALFLFWMGTGSGGAETDLPKIHKGVSESRKQLSGLKKKIQEEKQRIKEIRKKESSAISQLNKLDRSLVEKGKKKRDLDQKHKVLSRKVEQANQDLRLLTQNIYSQEDLLAGRLVALYKFADMEMPQMLFSTHPYEDSLSSRRYLASILSQDRLLIEDYRRRRVSVDSYRQQLKGNEQELQRLRKETEQKRAEIRRDRAQKNHLLNSIRDEKRVHLASIQEMEAASVQLQGLIDRLEKEIRAKARQEIPVFPGRGFGTLRGKLAFPVEGRVISTFGKNENPKFNTFTVQKGIEIEAPLGAEIRAVYPGRVLYADWFKGYGKILIIDHGAGYYTLSGHASSFLKKVGEEVRAGEVVALVGETGSLKGSCLYFEIRQRGKPLDPLEWLAHARAR